MQNLQSAANRSKIVLLTIDCARGTDSAGRGADARPLDPYIIRKQRSRAFQRCMVQLQRTSFTEMPTARGGGGLKMAGRPCTTPNRCARTVKMPRSHFINYAGGPNFQHLIDSHQNCGAPRSVRLYDCRHRRDGTIPRCKVQYSTIGRESNSTVYTVSLSGRSYDCLHRRYGTITRCKAVQYY